MRSRLLDGVGMETIDFQSGKLGKEIELFFEDLLKSCKNAAEIKKLNNSHLLDAIVKRHTNINLKTDLVSEVGGPCYMVPLINANHSLLLEGISNYLDFTKGVKEFTKILEENKYKAGVDLKACKVLGAFGNVEVKIHMPPSSMLWFKLTAKEITAVFLHELGHAFTFFEYFAERTTTNQVLNYISQNLTKDKPLVERTEIIYETAKGLGVTLNNIDDLAKECNKEKIALVLLKTSNSKRQSEINTGHYDVSSSEMLADQFASRHGYGKETMLALEKLGGFSISRSKIFSSLNFVISEFSLITSLIAIGGGAVFAVPLALGLGLGSLIANIFVARTDVMSHNYDLDETRIKRVREQYVALAKDPKLTKELVTELDKGIEALDELSSYLIKSNKIYSAIANFLFSDSKDLKIKIELQGVLEQLANNDLFVSAAKLKHI